MKKKSKDPIVRNEPTGNKITKKALLEILRRWDKEELLAIKMGQLSMKVLTSRVYKSKDIYETVAHMMAYRGYPFSPEKDSEILRLRDCRGRPVAFGMVWAGYRFDPEKHKDILLLADDTGFTVAHYMAWRGYCFDPERHRDILFLANEKGWTVAHSMVSKSKYLFDPEKHKEVLMITNKSGVSVAHLQAKNGFVFDTEKQKEICMLTDSGGRSVIYYFLKNNKTRIEKGEFDDVFLGMSLESLQEYINHSKKRGMKRVRERLENIYRIIKAKQEVDEKFNAIGLKL